MIKCITINQFVLSISLYSENLTLLLQDILAHNAALALIQVLQVLLKYFLVNRSSLLSRSTITGP